MYTCVWLSEGVACGELAEPYGSIALCPEHEDLQRWRVGQNTRTLATQALKHHDVSDFPGFCYFILLPDGAVKIGYSNTEELLHKRLVALKRELGPIVKLAVIPGGFVAEAAMHSRFRESRMPGPGERFKYTPEMADFLSGLS